MFFIFSVVWVGGLGQSQYLFDQCSELCNGRLRGRPQESCRLRMCVLLQILSKNAKKSYVIFKIAWKSMKLSQHKKISRELPRSSKTSKRTKWKHMRTAMRTIIPKKVWYFEISLWSPQSASIQPRADRPCYTNESRSFLKYCLRNVCDMPLIISAAFFIASGSLPRNRKKLQRKM